MQCSLPSPPLPAWAWRLGHIFLSHVLHACTQDPMRPKQKHELRSLCWGFLGLYRCNMMLRSTSLRDRRWTVLRHGIYNSVNQKWKQKKGHDTKDNKNRNKTFEGEAFGIIN